MNRCGGRCAAAVQAEEATTPIEDVSRTRADPREGEELEAFDRLTRLVVRLIGVPVALAVVIEPDRQVVVSQVGLPEPWASRGEMALLYSFCRHVVATDEPLIVEDARLDPRLRDSPAIPEPGVVAYAGIPLRIGDACVGSLCAVDSRPRCWTAEEIEIVRDLARAAGTELSLRKALADERAAHAQLLESEQRYGSLVAALSEGVVLQGADGALLACNASARRILGLTEHELLTRSPCDPRWRAIGRDGLPFPPELHPAAVTLATGEPQRDVIMGIERPDEGLAWISISSEAVGSGRPSPVVITFTDVTDRIAAEAVLAENAAEHEALRRMLENTLARYRTLAANLPRGGVFLFDADLRYVLAEGPLVAELTGGVPIVGRTPAQVFPAEIATKIEAWYREALVGATTSWRRPGDDGKTFDVTITPTRDTNGAITGGMALALDVTDAARSAAEQAALQEIAQAVARDSAPEDVLQLVVERVAALFEAVGAGVVRFDPDGQGTILAAAPVPPLELVPDGRVPLALPSALGGVASTGLPGVVQVYPERVTDPLLVALKAHGAVGGAATPITIQNRTWGALAFGGANPERLTDGIIGNLGRFANLVGIAISTAEAWQTLARQATTDHLTGLPNRRVFDERLASELSRAVRHDRSLALVLFDIDHFKEINDRAGHPAGDRVLAELGAVLLRQTRAGETIARVGGEEFAWILPETRPEHAYAAAERARAAIAALEIPGIGRIAVSGGIAHVDAGEAIDAATLVARADDALYAAKRAGRDTTVSHVPRAA